MKFDKLLENNDRFKLFIYQLLQIQRGKGVATADIKNQMNLSEFKFNKLIDELKLDIADMDSHLILEEKYITTEKFSLEDYQNLRLKYFKKSQAANFLVKIGLFEEITVPEFAEMNYMSSSSVYYLQAEINDFIAGYGLGFRSSKLVGEEKKIRSFYFRLLFDFYGGMELPFSTRINNLINADAKELTQLSVSEVKKSQLRMFLGIQNYRVQNHHEINEEFAISLDDFEQQKSLSQSENAYLYLYLVLNQYINAYNIHLTTTELEQKFISVLDDKLRISEFKIFEPLTHEVRVITQRWFNFQLTNTTFISPEQLEFFEQSYPLLHTITYDFVNDLQVTDGYTITELDRTYLYYEFMFCLLSFKDIQNYERPIKIVVDFSGGKLYNQFIRENIEYFKYLNIQVVEQLADDVDIYISDFNSSAVNCLKIIWKSPPLDSDWEEFADVVIALKGQSYE